MTKTNFLRISPTQKQISRGTWYLLFSIVFLSSLLGSLSWILPFELDVTQRNFLFVSINFVAAILIFRDYLLQFLQIDVSDALRIGIVSLIFWLLYWGSNTALGHGLRLIDPDLVNQNDQSIIDMIENNYWLMLLGTVFFAPVAEECFHRGLVFRVLYDRSPIAAFAVSTVIFSAIHLIGYVDKYDAVTMLLSFVQYIPAGLCLAAAYRLSGSLISPILIHMAVNAMGMFALR